MGSAVAVLIEKLFSLPFGLLMCKFDKHPRGPKAWILGHTPYRGVYAAQCSRCHRIGAMVYDPKTSLLFYKKKSAM